MWGYVDDLLDDFFHDNEEALKAEIEEDFDRESSVLRLAHHEDLMAFPPSSELCGLQSGGHR
jgi:hypothetical protein